MIKDGVCLAARATEEQKRQTFAWAWCWFGSGLGSKVQDGGEDLSLESVRWMGLADEQRLVPRMRCTSHVHNLKNVTTARSGLHSMRSAVIRPRPARQSLQSSLSGHTLPSDPSLVVCKLRLRIQSQTRSASRAECRPAHRMLTKKSETAHGTEFHAHFGGKLSRAHAPSQSRPPQA